MAYKVVILGDAGVGKSNLHSRFIYDSYHEQHKPTIGVDFGVRKFYFGSRTVSLHVWDTAGQERFQAMTVRTYLKDAHGVVLVYDISNRDSFANVLKWKRKVDTCSGLQSDVTSILVGNKADTDVKCRQVEQEEGLQVADAYSMLFMESSAKYGTNVEQVFRVLVGEIDRQHMNMPEVESIQCRRMSCSWMADDGTHGLTLSEQHNLYEDTDHKGCCSFS